MNHIHDQAQAILALLGDDSDSVPLDVLGSKAAECATSLIECGSADQAVRLVDEIRVKGGSHLGADAQLALGGIRLRALLVLDRVTDAEDETAALKPLFSSGAVFPVVRECEILVLVCEAGCLWRRNQVSESIRRLDALRSELLEFKDGATSCYCALELHSAHMRAGDLVGARACAIEAWVVARRIRSAYWEALSSVYVARTEMDQGRWSIASHAIRDALKIFAQAGNTFFLRQAKQVAGVIALKTGHLARGLELADEVREQTAVERAAVAYWNACMLRALVFIHQGKFAEARKTLDEEPEWQAPSKFSRHSLLTSEYLGDIELEQGNAKQALSRYAPALTQALALVPRGDVVAELRRRIAECHLLLGDPKTALGEAVEALAHCREIHERYDEAATHRVIAMAHAALGEHADAKKAFDAGFAEYDEIETPYEWGKLWLAYGDWLAADSAGSYRNLSAAREAYVAAIDYFERIGAAYRLEQVRKRLAGLDETMRLEGAVYAPTFGKVRPARRPRHSAELLRRSQWALDTFGLVTRSAPLLEMLQEIGRVAASDLPVLVLGESGTGKELVARGVHLLSGRTGEFMAINCSAVPEAMLEGEFFGYMRGSFTNAVADKPGLFEVAHDGTVFLDEIGEMSPDLQAKLLRFLETGTLRRVGATRDQRVDTRIVAATNRERAVLQSGNGFRSDLYYRLAHAVYELPPLRARGDDLELLIEHFLATYNRAAGKHTRFGDAALGRLLQHAWPGNVRELQAVIRKLVVAASREAVFTPRDLPMLEGTDTGSDFIGETLANEKKRIVAALEQAHWVKTDAAHLLRISRTTLLSKMKRLGVEG